MHQLKTVAVAALLTAGTFVLVATRLAAQAPPAPTPTFSKDVAPILYTHCASCHRPDDIAPMSLLTYTDARPWAKSIRDNVVARTMPPWHASPESGPFLNDRSLSEAEIDTLVRWANGGAPEGDPRHLPAAPARQEGWRIGTPDAVFAMERPFAVPASGDVEYQFFDVPTNQDEDKWLEAIEVRPGNRSVVHHTIVWLLVPPDARRQRQPIARPDRDNYPPPDERRPRNPRRPRGDYLIGVAVGTDATVYKPGTAKLLPKGSTLVFEMHYTPNGTPTEDVTSVGVRFAKGEPTQEVRTISLQNDAFEIPPGASDHRVDAGMTFASDITLWSIFAHTHLRGKKWQYALVHPDGRRELILDIPRYDFNWQTEYVFTEPRRIAKGTRLVASAWYDNSKANPDNPDPAASVRWGDMTWEEMQFSTFNVSLAPATATSSRQR